MTQVTNRPSAPLIPHPEAAPLLEACQRRAAERWRAWRDEHPGVDPDSDEGGNAVMEIIDETADELDEQAWYQLASLPQIWGVGFEIPNNDPTVRGVIRYAITDEIHRFLFPPERRS